MPHCLSCNKKITILELGQQANGEPFRLCPDCRSKVRDERRETDRLAAEKREAELLPAIKELISKQFPDRSYRTFVVVNWQQGGPLRDIGLTVLSGALGMSGPWLLAAGGQSGNSAVIVLFDDLKVGVFSGSTKPTIMGRPWEFLSPGIVQGQDRITSIRVEQNGGFPVHGVVNVSEPAGAINVSNAKAFFDLMPEAKAVYVAEQERFLKNDPKAWRSPAYVAMFAAFVLPPVGIFVAIKSLRLMRRSSSQQKHWIAWLALALSIVMTLYVATMVTLVATGVIK